MVEYFYFNEILALTPHQLVTLSLGELDQLILKIENMKE